MRPRLRDVAGRVPSGSGAGIRGVKTAMTRFLRSQQSQQAIATAFGNGLDSAPGSMVGHCAQSITTCWWTLGYTGPDLAKFPYCWYSGFLYSLPALALSALYGAVRMVPYVAGIRGHGGWFQESSPRMQPLQIRLTVGELGCRLPAQADTHLRRLVA